MPYSIFNKMRLRGMQDGLSRGGYFKYASEKEANASVNYLVKEAQAGMPTQEEFSSIGSNLTQQDLMSMQKILQLLVELFQQYQMSGGGGMPANQMAPAGMPGMPPGMMPPGGAMPPGMMPGMPPGSPMPTMQGMPPGMMPPNMGGMY